MRRSGRVVRVAEEDQPGALCGVRPDPALTPALKKLVEDYVRAFSSAVSGRGQPQADVLLAPGETKQVEAGRLVSTRRDVSWISVDDGETVFAGFEVLRINTGKAPFPVAPGASLTTTSSCRLRSEPLEDVFLGGRLWEGLRAFQRTALEWADRVIERDRTQELERMHARLQSDDEVGDTSLRLLAGVIEGDAIEPPDPSSSSLLNTCRIIGRALDLELRAAASWERGRGTWPDELRAIARASGVGYRRVVLTPGWSTHDNGPLLGFLREVPKDVTEEEWEAAPLEPVALIPRGSAAYDCVDPTTGTRRPVDGALADALEGFAFSSIDPCPPPGAGSQGPVALRDVWRLEGRTYHPAMGGLGALLGLLVPILTGTVFDATSRALTARNSSMSSWRSSSRPSRRPRSSSRAHSPSCGSRPAPRPNCRWP